MRLVEIANGTVTVELYPEDCTQIMAACNFAAPCADGCLMPSSQDLQQLRGTGAGEGTLHALAVAFEAAGMAALVLNEMPAEREKVHTLTALRESPAVWRIPPASKEGEHDAVRQDR